MICHVMGAKPIWRQHKVMGLDEPADKAAPATIEYSLHESRTVSLRAVIYARVSSRDKGQETENQVRILEEWCANPASGYALMGKYIDQKTGSTADREQFQRMFEDAAFHKFDVVLFWSLDRFSREGALPTLQHLQRLNYMNIHWRSYTEQYLDSAGIFKDAIISIMATLAKQERLRISERTIAGLRRAEAQAKREGREWKRGKAFMILDRPGIREAMKQPGATYRKVGKQYGISRTTVMRIVKGIYQPPGENNGRRAEENQNTQQAT